MIKQIAIFFVLLLCIPFVSYGVELRYASWNIRWEDPRDVENGDAWEKRKEPIANVIKYHDFDIVGLQEGSPYRLKQLMELLPEYDIILSDTMEYNPIIIKKGLFTVVDYGRFYLSKTPEKKSKSWDSKHARYCTWAKLKFQQDFLYIFNVHFDYHGKDAQAESAKLMSRKIYSMAGNTPFIFAGDLNFTSTSKSYKNLETSVMVDAQKIAEFTSTPNGSYNHFDPSRFGIWQLDHIFVAPGTKVKRFGILNETYYDGEKFRYPSDHSPVTIRFELSGEKY
ncbi:endonuclease/exonuclease/phosphatase family protein [uncultured Fibrobacter sp.]|jgi:endonuclease/exonuclease/phosphatase family metal-dependent hydrolase|uniref:endonuclease/exonuclease/phosphatase family protein n=1 Tax=uncultured Fibrobacter sp. TaxID=261512 RepID=UPI00261BFF55|nr:endonuclease/exonuclease/phosphatase family protein [uncultured Fibrobacter sp.]